MPMTLFFSKILLKKTYLFKQVLGAIVAIISVLVFFIPTFVYLANGTENDHFQSGWWWPVILILSAVPAALMNIIEELIFEDEVCVNRTKVWAYENA